VVPADEKPGGFSTESWGEPQANFGRGSCASSETRGSERLQRV